MNAVCYFCNSISSRTYHQINDPLGACINCGIFACDTHGDYFTGIPEYKCVHCQGKWLVASAISTQKANISDEQRSIVSRYLGDDYPLNLDPYKVDNWAINSLEDLKANFPRQERIIDQIDRILSQNYQFNDIFNTEHSGWYSDPLLSIILENSRRTNADRIFLILITFAAKIINDAEITNSVAPYLKTISESFRDWTSN